LDTFEPYKFNLNGSVFTGEINKWFSNRQWSDLFRRLSLNFENEKRGALGEIVFAGFCKDLDLPFEKDPQIHGKTPDFKVYFEKKDHKFFIFETTLLNPRVLDKKRSDEDLEMESSNRILMEIDQKYKIYFDYCVANNVPIIIGLFADFHLGELFFNDFQMRNSLFGEATCNFDQWEVELVAKEKPTAHGNAKIGIFSFKHFEHLASVIVCYQGNPDSNSISPKIPVMNSICHSFFDFDIWINPYTPWTNLIRTSFVSKIP